MASSKTISVQGVVVSHARRQRRMVSFTSSRIQCLSSPSLPLPVFLWPSALNYTTSCQGEYSPGQDRLCHHLISLLFLEQRLKTLYCVYVRWAWGGVGVVCWDYTLQGVLKTGMGHDRGEPVAKKKKKKWRKTTPSESPPMNTRRNYFRYGVTPFLVQHETNSKEKRKILNLRERRALME